MHVTRTGTLSCISMNAEAPQGHHTSDGIQRQDTAMRPTFVVNGQEGAAKYPGPPTHVPNFPQDLVSQTENYNAPQQAPTQQPVGDAGKQQHTHGAQGDHSDFRAPVSVSAPAEATGKTLTTVQDSESHPVRPPAATSAIPPESHSHMPPSTSLQAQVMLPAQLADQKAPHPAHVSVPPAKETQVSTNTLEHESQAPATQASAETRDKPQQQTIPDSRQDVDATPGNAPTSEAESNARTRQQEMERLMWLYVFADQFPTWK